MKTQKEIFVNSLVITQRESSHLITQKNGKNKFKILKLGLSRLKKKEKDEREKGNKIGRGEPGGVAYLRAREINSGIPLLLGACCCSDVP